MADPRKREYRRLYSADPCKHVYYDSWFKDHGWGWRRVNLFIRWHLQFTILRRIGIRVNLRPGD